MKTILHTTIEMGCGCSLKRDIALLSLLLTLMHGVFVAPLYAATVPKLKFSDDPIARNAPPPASFAPVIKKVAPNVVNIYSTKTVRQSPLMNPFFDDDMFRDFFGGPGGPRGPQGPQGRSMPRERRQQGLGSGVIVSEDGYIITNNHVVENADEVKVGLSDERTTLDAKVIGTDPQTDIAVLKVERKNLPAITVTDSEKLEVGDVVLAIGNPFGVGQTVTSGIISARSRGGMGIVDYEDFIQTDASINPGNSGGALVDAEGRLIGINTAILSQSGGSQGVGFAIPANLARSVMEQIISGGKVTRGYLGIMLQPLTPELAREFKVSDDMGALVGDVTPNSPAAEAGIKEGDVIVEFNGKKVTDARQLRLAASQTPPGSKATLKVIRDGKEKTFNVKLGELPVKTLSKGGRSGSSSKIDLLEGVEVTDLDARTRQQFSIPENVRGALVTEVDPSSPAATAGLQAGDVIVEINRKPVTKADEAIELSQGPSGDRVLLRVWGKGGARYVVVDSSRSRTRSKE
jgi:serine protease Do